MENFINLHEHYYIKKINENDEISFETISIEKIKLMNILNKKNIILQIDFNKLDRKEYKKILKKLLHIKNIAISNIFHFLFFFKYMYSIRILNK